MPEKVRSLVHRGFGGEDAVSDDAADLAARSSVVTPAPRDVWRRVLASDPAATAQQTPEWFDAIRRVSRSADASRLYTLPDGRELVVPILRRAPLPGVRLDRSYPANCGQGGILASGGLRGSDVRLVLTDLQRTPAISTRLNGNHDTAEQWSRGAVPGVLTVPHRMEVIDLRGGFSEVWERGFRSSARRKVRKAERSGLTVERDTTGRLMPVFYDLYLAWTDRRAEQSGVPRPLARLMARRREPFEKFEAVAAALGDRCRVWVASRGGDPIAGIITLVHGRDAICWRGYARKELAGPVAATNLLERLAIEDACESGASFYNLGQSGGVVELERFKQSLGARPRVSLEYRIEKLPMTRLENMLSEAESRVARLLAQRSPEATVTAAPAPDPS